MRVCLRLMVVYLLVLVVTGCVTSQESILYKGALKHAQPSLALLPAPNSYEFKKPLEDALKKKLDSKIDELFSKHHIAGITATALVPKKGIWETTRGYVSKPENRHVDGATVFFWASVGKLITSTIVHQLIVNDAQTSQFCYVNNLLQI